MTHSSLRVVLSATFLSVLSIGAKIEAQATVRRVPSDYPTIQQAINASVDGDTVLVATGTYVENINFNGKAITVTSEAGPEVTVIDGNHVSTVVKFVSNENVLSVLNGFTLRNGLSTAETTGTAEGGGIYIKNSSPTITHNIIRNNGACSGAGISTDAGSPIIQFNTITNNSLPIGCGSVIGGGIAVVGGPSAQILDNAITDNDMGNSEGGGLALFSSGSPIIRGNVISGNTALGQGAGIWMVNQSDALIVQNLIVGNKFIHPTLFGQGGGVYWLVPFGTRGLFLINNTIVDNDAIQGSGVYADGFDAQSKLINNIIVAKPGITALFCGNFNNLNPPIVNSNNIFSLQGAAYRGICPDQTGMNGNISSDPLFVNPSTGDYRLRPGSPSIDTGDNGAPDLPSTDLDGKPRIQDGNGDGVAVVDMGAYEATSPLDICIQDDSNGNVFRINSTTGDYLFTNCSGLTLSGMGVLIKRGSTITLQQYAGDRRLLVRVDGGVNRATAYIQAQGMTFTITDRNTADDTCACTAH